MISKEGRQRSGLSALLVLVALVTWHSDVTGADDIKLSSERQVRDVMTSFSCEKHSHFGYFADVASGCRGFHICQSENRHDSFVCPNNTLFNQKFLVCDWPHNVQCQDSSRYFDLQPNSFETSSTNLLATVEKVEEGFSDEDAHSLREVLSGYIQQGIGSLEVQPSEFFSVTRHHPSW